MFVRHKCKSVLNSIYSLHCHFQFVSCHKHFRLRSVVLYPSLTYVRTYVCTNVQVSVIESLRSRISELEYTNAKLTVELQNRWERESNNSSAELRQTYYTQLHTRWVYFLRPVELSLSHACVWRLAACVLHYSTLLAYWLLILRPKRKELKIAQKKAEQVERDLDSCRWANIAWCATADWSAFRFKSPKGTH